MSGFTISFSVTKQKKKESSVREEKCWEDLLAYIIGEKVSFSFEKVDKNVHGIEKDTKEFFEETEKLRESKNHL